MKSVEETIKDSLDVIEHMTEKGSTDKEIAVKIGVGYSTYKKYKATDKDLKAVVAQAKDKKNQEVEKALFRNATGYHYKEDVVTKIKEEVTAEDGTTILMKERVEINKVEKWKAADLNAQKYYLNNRDKLHWKDDPNKVANDKKLTKLKEKEINSKVIE